MPVRKIRNYRGRKNVIGKYPSIKLGRMVAFESQIELDFIITLDYEIAINWFEEQPLTIDFQNEGREHHYTPDFLYTENGQHILAECKPENFVNTDDNLLKFAIAKQWCEAQSWEFRVVTDEALRQGFRLKNIKLLASFSRHSVSPNMRTAICDSLRATGAMSIDRLLRSVEEKQIGNTIMPAILNMAYHHLLEVAIDDEPLSRNSAVSLPGIERRSV